MAFFTDKWKHNAIFTHLFECMRIHWSSPCFRLISVRYRFVKYLSTTEVWGISEKWRSAIVKKLATLQKLRPPARHLSTNNALTLVHWMTGRMAEDAEKDDQEPHRKHHIRQNICATRPAYREGRNPKAVKVCCPITCNSVVWIHSRCLYECWFYER